MLSLIVHKPYMSHVCELFVRICRIFKSDIYVWSFRGVGIWNAYVTSSVDSFECKAYNYVMINDGSLHDGINNVLDINVFDYCYACRSSFFAFSCQRVLTSFNEF